MAPIPPMKRAIAAVATIPRVPARRPRCFGVVMLSSVAGGVPNRSVVMMTSFIEGGFGESPDSDNITPIWPNRYQRSEDFTLRDGHAPFGVF